MKTCDGGEIWSCVASTAECDRQADIFSGNDTDTTTDEPEPERPVKERPEVNEAILQLGKNTFVRPPAHRDTLLKFGDEAIPHLLPLLDLPLLRHQNDLTDESTDFQNNVTIVAEAARLLGQLGATQAISKLKALSSSHHLEVQRDSTTALTMLEAKTSHLQLDRGEPYEQIANLWTTIFQSRQMPHSPEDLNKWAKEAIACIHALGAAQEKRDQAWAMLGSLYYKSVHPEWDGNANRVEKCPEAKKCFEEAVKIRGLDRWKKLAENL